MNKSSGNLHLSWKKAANEIEGSLNEIHIRSLNDSLWHNAPIPLQALKCEEEDEAKVLVVLERNAGPPPAEDTALTRAEESRDSDHTDSSSESGSLAGFESNFNPHYKTQVLTHPELEGDDSHDEAHL
ncbi:UNVERIFIED_CONTAM: hypothetical protein FKN15_032857 [Acipenser sinensis]